VAEQQFTAEIGRDVSFIITAMTCTEGVLDAETGTFPQHLSRLVTLATGVQTGFGKLERATVSITPMQEEVSTADSLVAHYETWKHDWELGLIGIRQLGPVSAVGLPTTDAVNPLTEIIMQAVGAITPVPRRRLAKVEITTFDRIWTFHGSLGPYRWDYSGPRGSDSLTLRPIDIGAANPTYVINPAA
jgi:hypothetical protein